MSPKAVGNQGTAAVLAQTTSARRPAGTMRRRFGIMVIVVLTSSVAVRLWGVQGLLFPIRVVSGSMGDVLPGPHWEVRCEDCRFRFRCGTDYPPTDYAVCPNCGCALNSMQRAARRTGRRVLIDRFSTSVRRPRRWEVVVVRPPNQPSRLAVKRVVGLPGERIIIRGGDIYANGAIVRKDLAQQRVVSVLVHDHRFRTANAAKGQSRWQPQSETGPWRGVSGRYRYSNADLLPHGSTATFAASEILPETDLDWLIYHHRSCVPRPHGWTDETPVTDNYGYNQGLSRDLSEVRDLILTCRVWVAGDGVLALLAHDGREVFQVQWNTSGHQLVLLRGETTVAQAHAPESLLNRHVLMETMVCDRRFQLALDGRTYIAYTYAANDRPLSPTSQPLAVGAAGVYVEVDRLCVWRDVYYTHPQLTRDEWSLPRRLAEDEYLLLGDNSPISVDGRHGAADGIVSRCAIIGRVVPKPRSSYPEA